MNQNRPYINKLVRIKQLQIQDSNHETILRQLKPLTRRLMQRSATITINNQKRKRLQQQRQFSINYQNTLLSKKIANMKSTYRGCSNFRTIDKTLETRNKSLNQVRKKDSKDIQEANFKIFQRIVQQKSTINRMQWEKDWNHAQIISKRITNKQFNLTHLKSKWNISQPAYEKYHKLLGVKMYRTKKINGHKMMINVQLHKRGLQILCDLVDEEENDYKVINIDKDQTFNLLEMFDGQLQKIIDLIHYDQSNKNVYIIKEESQSQDFYGFEEKSNNPEFGKVMFKGVSEKKVNFRTNEQGQISRIQKPQKKPLRAKQKKVEIPPLQVKIKTKEQNQPKTQPSNNELSKKKPSLKPKIIHNQNDQAIQSKKQKDNEKQHPTQSKRQEKIDLQKQQQNYEFDQFQQQQQRQPPLNVKQPEQSISQLKNKQQPKKPVQQNYEQQFEEQIQQA